LPTWHMDKWKLLEPIKVGTTSFRNRMVMAPMATCLAGLDGSVTKEMIDYYSERAKGALGAIIIEYTFVDKGGQGKPNQLGAYSDHLMPGLNQLAESIKASGTVAFLQIVHVGGRAPKEVTGRQPVAPSPADIYGELPRELTIAEIEEIQNAFAEAARRAKQAGFQGVEIHGAHDYLISQFLSSYMNRRTDKYGGALENRALFSLELIGKIREKVGNQFTLGYRMNGSDYVGGGITPDDASRFAEMLQGAGIDYVHVSAGIGDSPQYVIQPMYIEQACNVHLAENVKKAVKIPVITVGSHTVETAEEALREGKADLVAFGRPLLADPQLAVKLISGRIEDILPCIRGNNGCVSNIAMCRAIRCEVNPAAGREAAFRVVPAKTRKNVVVVGGGIAGMEAARLAALRGHEVTLIEKTEKLGGHLVEASVPEFKGGLKRLVNWSINQVSKGGIKIQLGTEVTPELVQKLKPDVLIVAVGSDYAMPAVAGMEKSLVVTASDVLLGKKTIGGRVVVLGGGLIGCETALYIAEQFQKPVSIVEMLDEILINVDRPSKKALTERLGKAGVEIHVGWRSQEIADGRVICTDKQGQRHALEADTVVLAIGLVERRELVEKFRDLVPQVYAVGDCVEARNIYHAFEDAWHTVFMI
jgi:2,4-dienoyl-CoA reductase-like NADH-dependent reductase (Old Yellow Enzyme family)/NADPH-dependent 2,4-dienoyl-CoA reductase/sulfur reductase-like enzyme